ncbi:efflux RND transporter permease subunit [Pseudomonadales bacterium]|jgi:HAE1 family hydrophobic/amphiphilic exporter-1|nr:efflux RND transporter permease subunit [Pseudomonadales bacterium]
MTLAGRAIARPVTVCMVTIAAMLFGSISLDRLGLTLLPELTYPTLTIRTEFDGAAPAEVEEQVTRRIEQRVGVVNGVRKMHSISAAGQSDVILEFRWGADMDMASIEVREKLDLVRLPIELDKPALLRLNPNLDPIYRFSLTLETADAASVDALQSLRRYADEFLKRKLDAVPGVAATIVAGGFEDEVAVFVDQSKLAQLDLTVAELGQKLQATNVNLSGGTLEDGAQEYLVRTLNQFDTIEDIRSTIIFQRGGQIIRLGDVAEVKEGQKDRDAIMRVNGLQAIEVSLYKEGDGNTVEVAANIRAEIERLTKNLGEGMVLTPIYDQSEFIESAISEVQLAAFQGAGLAVLVLFLFLKQIRVTLIIAVTVPASVMMTFAMMRLFDISLNVMSLGGIALAVGMLMDNAIVVLENIARRREQGESLRQASETGGAEVSGAVLASTMTTIAVFLPLAFVEGIAGQLFKDQALTVTFALLASLILAVTLIPMLSALGAQSEAALPPSAASKPEQRQVVRRIFGGFLRGVYGVLGLALSALRLILRPVMLGFDLLYAALAQGYAQLLVRALQSPATTILISVVLLVSSGLLLNRLALELIPNISQGEFQVSLELPPGTRIESTDALIEKVQQGLQDAESVARTYSVAGTGGRMDASAVSGGENLGRITVVLAPDESGTKEARVMQQVRRVLDDEPALKYSLERPQFFTFSTPLEIEVTGTDLDGIRSVAESLVSSMTRSGSFSDVESTILSGYPELQIEFDQDRIAALGLTVPQVAARVVDKVKGNVPTEFTFQDKKIDIRLRVDEGARDSKADIENLIVNPESSEQVRLKTVAKIFEAVGPADIQRLGQQRVGIVRANPIGADLAEGAAIVEQLLDEIPHPLGIKSHVGGQSEEMAASFNSLAFALLLALILVYLVMASLFESLLHPFVIMFTIPLAGIGAVLALVLTNTPVSVVVFIGGILLVGIVVNNAIVLVDRVNQFRRQSGYTKLDALVAGTNERLRPIMMTTLTTVLGLLPMALGFGEAAELRTPMAVTVIGGLMMSTLLTLVVIPVVYLVLDRSE